MALAVVVAEGVSLSVIGNTKVTVDVRPFAVERKMETKLLVVMDSGVEEAQNEEDVLVLEGEFCARTKSESVSRQEQARARART